MSQYSEGDLIMVLPQPVTISWVGYFKTYEELKIAAENANESISTYFEMRSEIVPLPDPLLDENTQKKAKAKLSNMFNKFDKLSPKEREEACELITFNIQVAEGYNFDNDEVMRRILNKGENDGLKIMVRLYPGDMAHPNE